MNERTNGRYVVPETPPRRLASQWEAIAGKLEERRSGKRSLRIAFGVAVVGVVAAGVAVIVIDRPWEERVVVGIENGTGAGAGTGPEGEIDEGAVFDSAGQAVGVELADGSRIELAADSRVEVTKSERKDLRLAVRSGTARFNVAPRSDRQVMVTTDGVEVAVYAREFAVSRAEIDGAVRVTVRVIDGEVEVRRTRGGVDEKRRIAAGESWSVEWPLASKRPKKPNKSLASGPEPEPEAEPEPEVEVAAPDEAETLFDAANEARRSGRHAEAATYFEELLDKHPSDARAALAAFELGRLRMDRLKDLRGAARAFELSVSRAETGSLHEDATARLAETYDRLGDARRCRETREAYLSRYPEGVHARQMRRLCETR